MKVAKQPPMNDPCWPARVEPLRLFLASPRNGKDLLAWRRSQKQSDNDLRNNLAYLESEGQIFAFQEKGVFFWVQVPKGDLQVTPLDSEDEELLQQMLPAPADQGKPRGKPKGLTARSG